MMRKTARELASEMKEISFSEFIAANPHLVGFESSLKMIPMSIHELVTNSLDACEAAGILPEIWVDLKAIDEKGRLKRYRLTVRDNGPGIPPKNVPPVFGKLLYGSKFGARKQSRGQQGIGVSAVVLISQIKTGEHTIVKSSTDGRTAHVYELTMDVNRNAARIHRTYKEKAGGWRGVEARVVLEAQFTARIREYLELTAAINPHLALHYDGVDEKDRLEVERRTDALPPKPVETKPHPLGIDYDLLSKMAARTGHKRLYDFLKGEFDRMRPETARKVIQSCHFDVDKHPSSLSRQEVLELVEAMRNVEVPPPSPECLSPVGEEVLVKGVIGRLRPEFIEAVTRKPCAMRGQPFLVEAIIAYGCEADIGGSPDPVTGVSIHRFVNRVPLLFSESSDVIIKAARDAGLGRYEVTPESRSHLFVHIAGVNIPYTSESKEAIKPVDEYYDEVKLAIQECGRKVSKRIRQARKAEESFMKGRKRALIHSLLLREINRFAGKKVADEAYAEAFGFEGLLEEVVAKFGLDVLRLRRSSKSVEEVEDAATAA
ncbi:DNA topoisomerase VI subunit B [Methanocella conradii]|nr:DNA topoisomerase VI subunit B [Methanocella conradii]